MKDSIRIKERFQILDVFRGIFASFVFIFHLRPFANGSIIDNVFFLNADLFVDFFFILSGFVIAVNYADMSNVFELKQFLKKRFLRIYPLHLVMLLAFLSISLAKGSLSKFVHVNHINDVENTLGSFFSSLLLLHSTPILNSGAVSWNIPSWSISAEMIAYLVFTLFIFISFSKTLMQFKGILPFIVLFAAVGLLLLLTHSLKIDYTFDFGFLRGIIGFYVGILTFKAYKFVDKNGFRKLSVLTFSFLEVSALLIVTISILFGIQLKSYGLVYELIFSFCILVFTFEKGVVSTVLGKSNFLKNLGKYSYSIYMTHALIISLFNILFIRVLKFPDSSYSYLFILNFALIYLTSSFTYKYIEMRFYTLGKT
jgi:peptidoglycan/LPS O-acetylase OafA/YrhL